MQVSCTQNFRFSNGNHIHPRNFHLLSYVGFQKVIKYSNVLGAITRHFGAAFQAFSAVAAARLCSSPSGFQIQEPQLEKVSSLETELLDSAND